MLSNEDREDISELVQSVIDVVIDTAEKTDMILADEIVKLTKRVQALESTSCNDIKDKK